MNIANIRALFTGKCPNNGREISIQKTEDGHTILTCYTPAAESIVKEILSQLDVTGHAKEVKE